MLIPANERNRWLRAVWLHDALRDAPPEELEQWPRAPRVRRSSGTARPAPRGPRRRARLIGVCSMRCSYHSVGLAEWDMVGRILYCADYLDPGRPFRRERRATLAERYPTTWAVLREVARDRVADWSSPDGHSRSYRSLLEQSRRPRHPPRDRRGRLVLAGWRGLAVLAAASRARPGARLCGAAAAGADQVEVLNGTRRQGLARVATRVLREHGIDVVFFGNADSVTDSTRVAVRRGDPGRGKRSCRGARRRANQNPARHASSGGRDGDRGQRLPAESSVASVVLSTPRSPYPSRSSPVSPGRSNAPAASSAW